MTTAAAHALIRPRTAPRLGRALAAALGGARFTEFPHGGHALPIQCADELNALLLAHLMAADG